MSTTQRTVTLHDGTDVEMWDQAPVAAHPKGYCDPHWARIGDRWHIVARRGARMYRCGPEGWAAWDVHDAVMGAHRALAALPAGLAENTRYITPAHPVVTITGGTQTVAEMLTVARDAYSGVTIGGQHLLFAA